MSYQDQYRYVINAAAQHRIAVEPDGDDVLVAFDRKDLPDYSDVIIEEGAEAPAWAQWQTPEEVVAIMTEMHRRMQLRKRDIDTMWHQEQAVVAQGYGLPEARS